MPTDTFFRLAEEKRARIIDCAWEEFTLVAYSDVSINRIIQKARIPRGSFYQYFEDKSDLFFFLMDQSRTQFIELFRDELKRAGGDLFDMMLGVYDALFQGSGEVAPPFRRIFELFRLNASMDVPRMFFERPREELEPLERLADGVDMTRLKRADKEYLTEVFTLLISAVGCTIARTLQMPEQHEQERRHLLGQIEIIKNGSAAVPEGGHSK